MFPESAQSAIRIRTGYLFVGIGLTLALASGCAKKENNQAKPESSAVVSSEKIRRDDYGNVLLAREPLRPFDQYQVKNVSSGFRVSGDEAIAAEAYKYRQLFWSGAKRDDALLAYDYLEEYRAEQDSFKRADIVKQQKPALEKAYREAQEKKLHAFYFSKENENQQMVSLGRYDAEKNRFEINFGIPDTSSFAWEKPHGKNHPRQTWGATFIGGEYSNTGSHFYTPKSEAEARAIEAALAPLREQSKYGNGNMVQLPTYYLGHVVGSNAGMGNSDYVTFFVVDGLAVEDPKSRRILFTVDRMKEEPMAHTSLLAAQREFFPQKD
ncbi:hypothetical protein AB4Z32_26275 [Massilia sp. 2TAF26]|uniref:hypothetical protein n=1 Tax=Massilia sp. 2TAF26 TaxID=3233012 RepID=UPI003F94AAFC